MTSKRERERGVYAASAIALVLGLVGFAWPAVMHWLERYELRRLGLGAIAGSFVFTGVVVMARARLRETLEPKRAQQLERRSHVSTGAAVAIVLAFVLFGIPYAAHHIHHAIPPPFYRQDGIPWTRLLWLWSAAMAIVVAPAAIATVRGRDPRPVVF